MKYLIYLFCFYNVFCFILMGFDKRQAIKERRRVSERTIMTFAFCFGAVGILTGMYAWHHKTKKIKFVLGVPIALAVNIGIIYLILSKMIFI